MTQGSEFKVVIGVEWSAKGEEMEESAWIFTGGISDMMANGSKGNIGKQSGDIKEDKQLIPYKEKMYIRELIWNHIFLIHVTCWYIQVYMGSM